MGCTNKSTQAQLRVSWTQRKFSGLLASWARAAGASTRSAPSRCFLSTGRRLALSLSDKLVRHSPPAEQQATSHSPQQGWEQKESLLKETGCFQGAGEEDRLTAVPAEELHEWNAGLVDKTYRQKKMRSSVSLSAHSISAFPRERVPVVKTYSPPRNFFQTINSAL